MPSHPTATCLDCGTPVSVKTVTRCRSCSARYRTLRYAEQIADDPGPNPSGVCECGCGQPTPLAEQSNTKTGNVMGKPQRFVVGHGGIPTRRHLQRVREQAAGPGPNPSGLCQCGCGGRAPLASSSNKTTGIVRGKPQRYRPGHQYCAVPFSENPYRVDPETGCWVWLRTARNYYGKVTVNGRTTVAHRWYFEQAHGPIPPGLHLDHLCRNVLCVNPSHCEPVTPAENSRRGMNTKLDQAKVEEIRSLAGTMSHREIGERFGVSRSQVGHIINRKAWRD